MAIRCLADWDDRDSDLTADGQGGVKYYDDQDREIRRRVRCRERVKFDGRSTASAKTAVAADPNGKTAEKEALSTAEWEAHMLAARAALATRCPSTCQRRRLIIMTEPPEITSAATKDPQGANWLAEAACTWHAYIECRPQPG